MDTMRKEYRLLNDQEKKIVEHFKELGNAFVDQCNLSMASPTSGGSPRELSLAKTKMEEAVMWAVKGITG